jgi:predicted ester cyclase
MWASALAVSCAMVAHATETPTAPEIHCSTPAGQQALARYQAYAADVLNGGHLESLDTYLAPQFHWHDAPPGMPDGIAPMRHLMRDLVRAFPDRKVETRFALCADDLVLVQQLLTGTNTGPLLGRPPTGKVHHALHTEIYRIVDGRITELWGEGVIPVVLLQSGWKLVWPGDSLGSGPAGSHGERAHDE